MALALIAACQLMVVLDATVVNIALPEIQTALGFSTTALTAVVGAYTLTFGGLLLLGGRAGDLLGRRRVFVFGILLFVVMSLLGGLAQEPWQLLVARALQGVGGAIASPTALALVTTTFPEGPERNRALGVFAAVSAGGGALGLLVGGLITEWLDWRWVLFVNVPIGLVIVAFAKLYINESARQPGRFDLAGALTSTLGVSTLVYGFVLAAAEGWGDRRALLCFAGAAVLLTAFLAVERFARAPVTPLRLFRDRDRAGTYIVMMSLSAVLFGVFFYIVLFVQDVLGYSAVKAGVAFLPVTVAIAAGAGLAQRLLPPAGPKSLMVTGSLLAAGAMAWLALIDSTSGYLDGVLGPMLVFGVGMGLNVVTLTLTAVSGVTRLDTGAASALLNVTQQLGGVIGLALLTTVYGSAGRAEAERQMPDFLAHASADMKAAFESTGELPGSWGGEVLAAGMAGSFAAAVVIAGAGALTALFVVRVRRSDVEELKSVGGTPF
ncbi:MFS transporter [Actinocorallia sp. API 0066]|uniref:MFS transporter n=1 Tax=Actinocorallia sp. API 0066 TaxID=2896846 RepID=UPI001E33C3AA|nr:MFS transporter [Actinocorallia sp. API 0066]MCD0448628.1 MFS transporter [Actinocorallia sp. API 0066]